MVTSPSQKKVPKIEQLLNFRILAWLLVGLIDKLGKALDT
jgi:hypothetical protein